MHPRWWWLLLPILFCLDPYPTRASEGIERAAPAAGAPLVRTFAPADAGLGNFETLCLDARGRLWVGSLTGGGLKMFDGVRWQGVPTDWRSNAIGMLVTAGDGTVWAGCLDEVGCLEGPADFLRSKLSQLPPELRKFGMLRNGVALSDGALLTSTTHIIHCTRQGLRAWAIPEGVGLIFLSGGVPHFRVRDGDRSYRRLRDGQWERVETAEIDAPGTQAPMRQTEATRAWLGAQRIMNRNRLPDGRILIGTRSAGAVIVGADGRIEEHLTTVQGLPAEICYGVVIDRLGGVWISHHSSLSRLDLRVRSHGLAQGLGGLVTHVVRAGPDLLVLGPQGTKRLDETGRFRLVPGQPNSSYDALEVGEEWLLGGLPAGTLRAGVFRPVEGEGVREIAKWSADGARTDSVFGGGEREVYRLERRASGAWAVAEVVARGTGSTSDLLALGDGWLWQATNWLALQRLDLRKPAAERQPEIVLPRDDREKSTKPSRGLVYLLRFEDRMLVASWRGFFRWSEERRALEPDRELSALAFETSPGVALAAAGRDWLCFQEDAPPGRVRLVERGSDGRLSARELSGGLLRGLVPEALALDRVAGRVWLGEGGSIVGLDARALSAPSAEAVQASVRSALDAQGQPRWREGEGELVLPPERRETVLDYAANDYEVTLAGRPALEFRTRLDGFDQGWSGWTGEARRGYTNLPPGRYAFEVEARTLAGRTVRAQPLTIVVPARWWESTWGRSLLGLGGATLLALVAGRWAQRRLRERVRRLNVEVALQQERLRIARDMHDGVGSGLGRLRLTLEQCARPADESSRAELLAQASSAAQELAEQAREIIWAVTPENDTLDHLLDRLAETVQRAAQAAGLRCRLDLPEQSDDRPIHAEARHQILLAVKEAAHNAVKHARASELRLRAALDGGRLAVEVADDGQGFDPAGGGRPGGLGLGSLQARAEALRGEACIESAPGAGTVVRFLFPLTEPGA